MRGKPRWLQQKQAAYVHGPGRSRYSVEREAAMVTADTRGLAKVQGPGRPRYSVEREFAMVTAETRGLPNFRG